MRTAQVIITTPKTHDGLGNKYGAGETTPPLPYENAAKIVEAGRGEFLKPSDKNQSEQVVTKAKRRGRKRTAEVRMDAYDTLPAELRALAQEHGNEILDLYQSGETVEAILEAYK